MLRETRWMMNNYDRLKIIVIAILFYFQFLLLIRFFLSVLFCSYFYCKSLFFRLPRWKGPCVSKALVLSLQTIYLFSILHFLQFFFPLFFQPSVSIRTPVLVGSFYRVACFIENLFPSLHFVWPSLPIRKIYLDRTKIADGLIGIDALKTLIPR